MNKWFGFGLFFVSTLVLINAPYVFADHDGSITNCGNGDTKTPFWDPNTNSCVSSCPAGTIGGGDSKIGLHCLLIPSMAVGGEIIGIDTVSVLVAGTQTAAAWMIPVIVSGIGFAIVIARKF